MTIKTDQVDNLKDIVNDCLEDAFSKENAVQEAKSAYEAHKRAYEDLVESCELAKAQVEMFASNYDKNREEFKIATQEVQLFDIEARKHDWYGGNINEVRPENLFLAKLPLKEILHLLEKDTDGDFEQELQGMTLDQCRESVVSSRTLVLKETKPFVVILSLSPVKGNIRMT